MGSAAVIEPPPVTSPPLPSCTVCGQLLKAANKRGLCLKHWNEQRRRDPARPSRQAEWQQRQVALGNCRSCGQPRDGNRNRCGPCLRRHAKEH